MPIKYKIDIMAALKDRGYPTTRLKREKIFGEATMTNFRRGIVCYGQSLDKLCRLLDCQPGDIIEYVPDDPAGN